MDNAHLTISSKKKKKKERKKERKEKKQLTHCVPVFTQIPSASLSLERKFN